MLSEANASRLDVGRKRNIWLLLKLLRPNSHYHGFPVWESGYPRSNLSLRYTVVHNGASPGHISVHGVNQSDDLSDGVVKHKNSHTVVPAIDNAATPVGGQRSQSSGFRLQDRVHFGQALQLALREQLVNGDCVTYPFTIAFQYANSFQKRRRQNDGRSCLPSLVSKLAGVDSFPRCSER